jgi:ubiquitin C-terminal hydrolase
MGLANLGNTCFLNVVLQALRLSPPIGILFLSEDVSVRKESKKSEMVTAFQTFIRDFWSARIAEESTPTMVPRGFLHALHNVIRDTDDDWYHHGQQADAAEALQYILDSLHDAMYRRVKMDVRGKSTTREETSQIKAIESWASFFGGQTQICIRCNTCGSVSERYEPWLMIKAPIPGADAVGGPVPTLDACIQSAFAPESIEDYHCDTCKTKQRATITTRISRLPPITIVTVKRFTNSGHKVRGKIAWDLSETDYSSVMAFHRDPFSDSRGSSVYETFAVIEHHGSTHGGHYHMYARQNDAWFEYDDNSVRNVHPDTVVTADSYIAFMMPKSHAASMLAQFDAAVKRVLAT